MIKVFEAEEEERRVTKNRGLEHFAEWTKWDVCMEQDRDWQRLIHEDDQALFRFEIAATEDQLPTPGVLRCWEILTKEQTVCPVCKVKQDTLKHILSSCNSGANSVLKQGRYTRQHDCILLVLFQHIRSLMKNSCAVLKLGLKRPPRQLKFTRAKATGSQHATWKRRCHCLSKVTTRCYSLILVAIKTGSGKPLHSQHT